MSYVKPSALVPEIIAAGESKVHLRNSTVFIRAFMAGAILAIAAFFAISISVQTGSPIVGAVLFPIGFVMLNLMGYDLLTGVFLLLPLAYLDGRKGVTLRSIARNWSIVFLGNFSGAFMVAFSTAIIFTFGFSTTANEVGETIANIGVNRTIGYKEHGAGGMLTLFVRGVLCNWMVSLGVVGAMVSTTVSGKVIAMWMPIMLFFAMVFEHSVVNMYIFPTALLLNAEFSVADYHLWNELPVMLGNLVGGLLLTGLPLYYAHYRTKGATRNTVITGEYSKQQ